MKNYNKESELSSNYKMSSLLEMVIEYYMLSEADTGLVSEEETALVTDAFKAIESKKSVSSFLDKLEDCREEITEKMQVLTAYVDRLLVFEYVINRIEYRYTMTEEEINEKLSKYKRDEYVNNITNYIFSDKDNVVVNDKIREIVSELPVRMARSKFLEHIKNSIMLYSDSDRYSLDGYIYMLRTVTMLYKPKGIDKYFTEFGELVDELSGVDYNNITSDYYAILKDKIVVATSKIKDITDIYMSLQKLINMFIVYGKNEQSEIYVKYEKYADICYKCIAMLNDVFEGKTDNIAEVEAMFTGIEGIPEELYEKRVNLEAIVCDYIKEDNGLYDAVKTSEKLMGSSLFAELEEADTEPVTEEYLKAVTDELIADIKQLISDYSRPVVRAVYAMALGKLPVFFGDSGEVTQYISDSLAQCNDASTLLATYNLIDELCWGD